MSTEAEHETSNGHAAHTTMTPYERVLRARAAAYVLHSHRDSRELTAPARKAFNDRFEREVDPERLLDTAERARRAQAAKKAYFTRLAMRSARARRLRAASCRTD
jgi:hypothetical protein